MPCKISCTECELDQRFADCVIAHKRAKEHENRYTSHYVTLYNPAPG
mgnify:CR=1 FL=1|jgi:hypothetical protein